MSWATLVSSIFLLATLTATAKAQIAVGEQLPELRGEYLTGRAAALPKDVSGRVALLMLGFSYDSRIPVEAWTKRFRRDFNAEPRVTFFEIPVIGGMARLGKWFIDSGMRRGTPKADQENVITVYGSADIWKRRVGFRDPRTAYLILIDQQGKVAWVHAGGFDEASYSALASQVSKLFAGR